MDDSDFEKLYFVKTDNRILTMQIFTSSLLRYIVDFKTKYKIIPEITIKKKRYTCVFLLIQLYLNLIH